MTAGRESIEFSDADLSPFFHDADRNSDTAQRRYLRQLQAQLILLVIAAVSGAFVMRVRNHGADYAGVIGAVAFAITIFINLYAEHEQDEREWYESRAAAESSKTLCWRYSVAGYPFPESMPEEDAKRLLVARFSEVGRELKYLSVSTIGVPGGEVTSAMASLRSSPREFRIKAYSQQRILSQEAWYATKSNWNEGRARLWLKVVLIADALGLAGSVLKASGATNIDLLGIFAALSASVGAWLQSKQHRNLATAYNVAARELRQVSTLVNEGMNAEEWANFVDQAEEAISREHTMWVASRVGRRIAPR